MKITLIVCLLLVFSGCSSLFKPKYAKVAADPDQSDSQLEIIDAHTHTNFTNKPEPSTGLIVSRSEYLRQLKEAGAVGAVSHTQAGGKNFNDLRTEGVVHCAGASAKPDLTEIESGLKTGQYGCIKIYLGYVHLWANDPHYRPLYKLAQKYDVPVVFHTGDTYSTTGKLKYADPLTIDEVAVDYPKVNFVIAHCGNPWIQSAAEVAYKNPNVYLDGSALLVGDLDKMPEEKVEEFVIKPLSWVFGYLETPTKLMFGTDWPLNSIASYARAFKKAIPKEHWKAVFRDNAVKVFKIPTKSNLKK